MIRDPGPQFKEAASGPGRIRVAGLVFHAILTKSESLSIFPVGDEFATDVTVGVTVRGD